LRFFDILAPLIVTSCFIVLCAVWSRRDHVRTESQQAAGSDPELMKRLILLRFEMSEPDLQFLTVDNFIGTESCAFQQKFNSIQHLDAKLLRSK